MSGLDSAERLNAVREYLEAALSDWEPEPHEPKQTKRGRVLRAWRLAAYQPVDGESHPAGTLKTDPGVPSHYILIEA